MEVTPTGITLNDQQRDRIAGLLALEVQELSSIFSQLQDATQAAAASNKLFQQLDARATQLAGADSWKVEAEEAKASLTTEKINYGIHPNPLPSPSLLFVDPRDSSSGCRCLLQNRLID